MKKEKLYEKAQRSQNNFSFHEMRMLVEAFGFRLKRIKGSHFIYFRPGVPELVNIQEQNGKAKSYQVHDFLLLVDQYCLELEG